VTIFKFNARQTWYTLSNLKTRPLTVRCNSGWSWKGIHQMLLCRRNLPRKEWRKSQMLGTVYLFYVGLANFNRASPCSRLEVSLQVPMHCNWLVCSSLGSYVWKEKTTAIYPTLCLLWEQADIYRHTHIHIIRTFHDMVADGRNRQRSWSSHPNSSILTVLLVFLALHLPARFPRLVRTEFMTSFDEISMLEMYGIQTMHRLACQ